MSAETQDVDDAPPYRLAAVEQFDVPELGEPVIDVQYLRDMSEHEVRAYHDARDFLIGGCESWLYGNLLAAYRSYHHGREEWIAQISERKVDPRQALSDLGMRCQQWLNNLSQWTDRTKHRLSETYGDGSPEFTSFVSARDAVWAASPEFRFASKLRSFGEHAGSPLQDIRLLSSLENPEEVQLLLLRDELLRWNRWSPATKHYLESGPERFEIEPVMYEVMQVTDHLAKELLGTERESVSAAYNRIEGLLSETLPSAAWIVRWTEPVEGGKPGLQAIGVDGRLTSTVHRVLVDAGLAAVDTS